MLEVKPTDNLMVNTLVLHGVVYTLDGEGGVMRRGNGYVLEGVDRLPELKSDASDVDVVFFTMLRNEKLDAKHMAFASIGYKHGVAKFYGDMSVYLIPIPDDKMSISDMKKMYRRMPNVVVASGVDHLSAAVYFITTSGIYLNEVIAYVVKRVEPYVDVERTVLLDVSKLSGFVLDMVERLGRGSWNRCVATLFHTEPDVLSSLAAYLTSGSSHAYHEALRLTARLVKKESVDVRCIDAMLDYMF
ncbi:MAG: hypothetical protein ACK4SY_07160 [Pyrobaculum sp.]